MSLREKNLNNLANTGLDVLIIGGGINGAVSAASLARRGLKVGLIDARDFAGFTSQHSSNLVWGGIKYMEGYEFGLVNQLCKSRNELMRSFPSTVKEIRFLATVSRDFRNHRWVIWAGSWLYWLFGRAHTHHPKLLTPKQILAAEPNINVSNSQGGIEYSDAFLHDNDARFVFNFIRSAMDKGCIAVNYVESISAKRSMGQWHIEAKDLVSENQFSIKSKVLINATGAFVDNHNKMAGVNTLHRHVFSKGIHLIVPRLSEENRVLAFFASDGRLFFVIPMASQSCVGTTDTRVDDPHVQITNEDIDFVLDNINANFTLSKPLTRKDVISSRCGVRPLVVKKQVEKAHKSGDSFLQLSRKHIIETDREQGHISIFGGKLTDCLNIGEEIADEFRSMGFEVSDNKNKWYGEVEDDRREQYFKFATKLGLDELCADDTKESVTTRLWRRYGPEAIKMLGQIQLDSELVKPAVIGSGLLRCEIDHIKKREMIVHLQDLLRRRSKIELVFDREYLHNSKELRAVCDEIFDDQAEAKWQAYFEYIASHKQREQK